MSLDSDLLAENGTDQQLRISARRTTNLDIYHHILEYRNQLASNLQMKELYAKDIVSYYRIDQKLIKEAYHEIMKREA